MITILLTLLGAAAITAASYAARWFYDAPEEESFCLEQGGGLKRGHLAVCRWTADSEKYSTDWKAPQPKPFNRRKLLPWLLGGSVKAWHALTAASLVLTGPALAAYLMLTGASPAMSLAGVAAFTALWGVFGLLVLCPVLLDAPAMLLALLGAVGYQLTGSPYVLALAGLLAGCIKESSPVFMTLYAWSPWALVGMLIPAYLDWRGAPKPEGADAIALANPFKFARNFRNQTFFTHVMIAPWGLLLPLALLNPSWQLSLTLAVAYGQILMASDLSRLNQQAAPVVIAAALGCQYVPPAFWPLVVLAGLVSPWQKPALEAQPVRLQKAA